MRDTSFIDIKARYLTTCIMDATKSGIYINSASLYDIIYRTLEECVDYHETINIRQASPVLNNYGSIMGKIEEMANEINEIKNICSNISNDVGEIENRVTLHNIL